MKNDSAIHSLDISVKAGVPFVLFLIIIIVSLLFGGALGYLFSTKTTKPATSTQNQTVKTDTMAGINDKKTFKDKSEGLLKEGGVDGEGNFHLERPGGISQNVYLTSTTVDLSQYVGKKIRVYGETFKGNNAGWLMDVGLVEVL